MYSHVHKLKTVPFSPALVIGLDDSRGNDLATFVGEEEEEEVKSLHMDLLMISSTQELLDLFS